MIKVSELTGALLDYWTGRAEGYELTPDRYWKKDGRWICAQKEWNPSQEWVDGGPLVEKYAIELRVVKPDWMASSLNHKGAYGFGQTQLQAICRAVVRAKFGDEVEEVAGC